MLSTEYMIETYPPETFFREMQYPAELGPPEYSDTPGSWTPINVGALQAGQVQAAARVVGETVTTVVKSATDIVPKIGEWIQTTGKAVMWIAVLGLGAWALSSIASMRR